MSSSRGGEDELTGKRPYTRECMNFVRVCGVRRLASLIAVCMEWGPTPTDELTEELKQPFLRLWERADHIEVIILFLSYLQHLKRLDLSPIAGIAGFSGIAEAGGIRIGEILVMETPTDIVFDSFMTSVSVDVPELVYRSIMEAVNATPAAKADTDSLCKQNVFMEFLEEVGGVSALAECILHLPSKPCTKLNNELSGLIPCLILYIAWGNEFVRNVGEAEESAVAVVEAEERPVQEAVPKYEYAPGIMRMRDISLETFKIQHVMTRMLTISLRDFRRAFSLEPVPPAQLVVRWVDMVLMSLFLLIGIVYHTIRVVWLAGEAYLRHLGGL